VTANETDLDLTEPVLICVLGSFRVVKAGEDVPVRSGGKTAILLSSLALRDDYRASRESLLEMLWPETEATRSAHSLNSLIHKLRQMLGDVLAGVSCHLQRWWLRVERQRRNRRRRFPLRCARGNGRAAAP
jgi:two-component SAPR family response regulator